MSLLIDQNMQYMYFYWAYNVLLPESTIWGHSKFCYSRITNLSPLLNSSFVKRMTNASNGHQHTSTPSTTYHTYLSNKDSTTCTRTYQHPSHSPTRPRQGNVLRFSAWSSTFWCSQYVLQDLSFHYIWSHISFTDQILPQVNLNGAYSH